MTVGELAQTLGFEVLTGDVGLNREVMSGYVSDLLSDVIANAGEGSVWITVQRHVNILGVAKLKDISAIIIPRGLQLESQVLGKAKDEQIPVLRDYRSAFEIAGVIFNILNRGQG
jgi:predicted transcriptional regulator